MSEPTPLASPDTEDPDSPYEGYELCIACLHENPDDAALCRNCWAPIDARATLNPFFRIFAEGFILRAAATNCTNRLTLAGIWLICGIPGLAMLFFLLTDTSPRAYSILYQLFLVAVYLAIPIRTTRSYLRNRAPEHLST